MFLWPIIRYVLSIGNVAVSLLIGLIAFGYIAVNDRPLLLSMSKAAGQIRDKILAFMPGADGEIMARLVLHESTVLMMFFTLGARAALGLVQLLGGFIFRRQTY